MEDLKEKMVKGVPMPVAFDNGSCDRAEWYHFKDAGPIWLGDEERYKKNPFYDKVKRNITRIGIEHYSKDDDLFKK